MVQPESKSESDESDAALHQPFPNTMRLRKNAEFRRVFASRNSVADEMLVIYALKNGSQVSRLGACVSRKNGNAVQRNRWKRRIREGFRVQQAIVPQGYDYVVLPRLGSNPDGQRIAASLAKLAPQAAKRCGRRRSGKENATDPVKPGSQQLSSDKKG